MSDGASVSEDTIVKEYLLERNMKTVARKLSVPVGTVRRVIVSRCGPLYRLHGLCRVYLYMMDRCFASAKDVATSLRTNYQSVYRAFSELEKRNVGFRVVKVHKKSRTFVYLVWNKEKCLDELSKKVSAIVA
ncbi:MAG: hypothetical protein QW067_08375 [Thermofilaceae archaeon]